jgi:hypothetical protein
MESQSLTQVQYQIICPPLTSRASFSFLFLSFCQNFTIGQPKKKGYDLCIGVFGKKKA